MATKKVRTKRRMTPQGAFLLVAMALAIVWVASGVYRTFRQRQMDAGEGISIEGNFADSPRSESESAPGAQPTAENPANTADAAQSAGLSGSMTHDVPENCVLIPMEQADLHCGRLLQLDAGHEFTGVASGLGTFEEKSGNYRLRDMDLEIMPEVVTAMNQMADAYQASTGNANLMVYSTTAAYDVEGSLYPDALPDRATGYCVDLCVMNADETISKIVEPIAWMTENAYRYGFVFSGDEAGGETSAPYHLRYVGAVSAGVMHEQSLSLNAYIDGIRSHTLHNPLSYTVAGVAYKVYYVPAEVVGKTEVPVPLNANYEISGNNIDGFIVETDGSIGK